MYTDEYSVVPRWFTIVYGTAIIVLIIGYIIFFLVNL